MFPQTFPNFLTIFKSMEKWQLPSSSTTIQFNVTHINYISFYWHNNATKRTNISLSNFVLKHLLCVILNYFFNVRSHVIQIVWFIYNNDNYHFYNYLFCSFNTQIFFSPLLSYIDPKTFKTIYISFFWLWRHLMSQKTIDKNQALKKQPSQLSISPMYHNCYSTSFSFLRHKM